MWNIIMETAITAALLIAMLYFITILISATVYIVRLVFF